MSHAARLLERHRGKEALSFLGRLDVSKWPRFLLAEWWGLKGQAEQQRGEFRSAHRSFLKSHAISPAVETALALGDTARQLELFHEAIAWYRRAADAGRREGDRRPVLDALAGQAMALRGLGCYADAIRAFHRLLSDYRKRRDREGIAYALWALGTTARFAGRLNVADRHLRSAVAAYGRLHDESGLAYARCGWGGALRMRGFPERSRKLYELAHKTFRRQNDAFGMAYSSCGQANGWRMSGQLSRALPLMERAEKGYRALRLHGPLGFVLWSRAQLLIEKNALSRAAAQLRQAKAAFRRAKDPRGLVYVDLGWAELARRRKSPASALYAIAARNAAKSRLLLEETHAQVRSGRRKIDAYRRLGVSISNFSRYTSLP